MIGSQVYTFFVIQSTDCPFSYTTVSTGLITEENCNDFTWLFFVAFELANLAFLCWLYHVKFLLALLNFSFADATLPLRSDEACKLASVSRPIKAMLLMQIQVMTHNYLFMIKVFLVNVSMMPKGSTNLVLHFGGKRRLCRRQMLLMSRISLGPAMLALFGIPITLPSDEDA